MSTTSFLLQIAMLGMALGLVFLLTLVLRVSIMYLLERGLLLVGVDWRGWTADWVHRSLDRPPLRWQLALTFPLAAGLLLLLLLQALGLVRRVPFSYNLRNLFVRWRTTLLTALAFTLVVALMTVMLAFVNGMYRLTEGSGHAENVIVMSDGATDEAFSSLGYRDTSEVEWHPAVLRDAAGRPLASWEVYLIINQPIPESRGGGRKRRFLQVRGLDDPARSGAVHGLPLNDGGTWFSDAGVQRLQAVKGGGTAIQAVLGEGIARELGKDYHKETLEIGDVFEAGPRRW